MNILKYFTNKEEHNIPIGVSTYTIKKYIKKIGINGIIRENHNISNHIKVLQLWDKYKNMSHVPIIKFAKELGFKREYDCVFILGSERITLATLDSSMRYLKGYSLRARICFLLCYIVAEYLAYGLPLNINRKKYIDGLLLSPGEEATLIELIAKRLYSKEYFYNYE